MRASVGVCMAIFIWDWWYKRCRILWWVWLHIFISIGCRSNTFFFFKLSKGVNNVYVIAKPKKCSRSFLFDQFTWPFESLLGYSQNTGYICTLRFCNWEFPQEMLPFSPFIRTRFYVIVSSQITKNPGHDFTLLSLLTTGNIALILQ